jgi:hypothetical protein
MSHQRQLVLCNHALLNRLRPLSKPLMISQALAES